MAALTPRRRVGVPAIRNRIRAPRTSLLRMQVRTRNYSDVVSERNLKKSTAILLSQQCSILFHGGLIRFRFALTASTPMNIDTARKDIQHRNQRVKRQAYLGSEEGQSNRNDVDEWRHQRPVHRTAD